MYAMIDRDYNAGVQPLDRIMTDAGLSNHEIVSASDDFLTHKAVQKARRGRKLTRRSQEKVLRALNKASGSDAFQMEQIFTYNGK